MQASDIFQANVISVERFDFRLQITAKQTHQKIYFRLRPLLPVLFGESIERQGGNSDARGGLNRRPPRSPASPTSGPAPHVPAPGPAPVSVHDDGDVLGKPSRIEAQINLRFLAVHPSRNRVSQAELSESKLPHEIQCVQCDSSFRAASWFLHCLF